MFSLKLPSLDDNPILLAETRPSKINEFIQKLPFGNPITACGFCKPGDTLHLNADHRPRKIVIQKLIEHTTRFERFQYNLI